MASIAAELPDKIKDILRQFARTNAALVRARQQTFNSAITGHQKQLQHNQLETNVQNLKNRKAEIEKELPMRLTGCACKTNLAPSSSASLLPTAR